MHLFILQIASSWIKGEHKAQKTMQRNDKCKPPANLVNPNSIYPAYKDFKRCTTLYHQ